MRKTSIVFWLSSTHLSIYHIPSRGIASASVMHYYETKDRGISSRPSSLATHLLHSASKSVTRKCAMIDSRPHRQDLLSLKFDLRRQSEQEFPTDATRISWPIGAIRCLFDQVTTDIPRQLTCEPLLSTCTLNKFCLCTGLSSWAPY